MAGKRTFIGTLLLLLTFVTPVFAADNAQGQADDKIYKISIAPYAWFTSMKGDLTVRGISTSLDVSYGDINDYIDFAGFVNTELSFYDKFGVIADVNYAAFSKEKRHKFVTLGGETSLFMTGLAEVLPKNRTGVIATQPDEENTHVQAKESCPGFQGPSGPDCSFRR